MHNNYISLLIFIVLTTYSGFVISNQYCLNFVPNNWDDSRYVVKTIDSTKLVVDKQTNLMWMQCSLGNYGENCELGEPILKNWKGALQIARNSFYGKFYDWRIPNYNELRSIVTTNCSRPSINTVVFPNSPRVLRRDGTVYQNHNICIWSSSPLMQRSDRAWAINFEIGYSYQELRTTTNFVRLVRSIE